MGIILISEFTRLGLAADLEIELDADPTTADVGEWITFNWTDNGGFYSGQIFFGDGNITILASIHANSSVIHKYETEGQYNVTLYATTEGGTSEDTDSILIEIKNNPPQFDISLPNEAFEDEEVNVSVVDLVESDHDLEPGVLSFVYDFADGETVNTNQSSIIHKWKNGGNYRVTVTVIDDQGALDQKFQDIQIYNKDPDAYFTFAPTSASNDTVASYYGTYDFRSDIIGQEPEDWSVYDSDNVDLETAILRPNGDGDTIEWTPSVAGDHYALVDEETPDGDIIIVYKDPYDYIQTERFEMGTVDMAGGTVVQISISAYGKLIPGDLEPIQPRSKINLGGWKSEKTWDFSSGYNWKTLTWTGLNGSQTDLDNLIIEFEAVILCVAYGEYHIDTVYCEIFYEHNLEVSIVNETGYFREVVKFYDHDTTERVWMENSFNAQTYGTIELYIKSSDASIDTWTLVLYEGSTYGLKLFMKNDQWNYINGTSGTISECGTPLDNQWYWIRFDFCTSGFYLGLSAHQFRLTVDNSSSTIYYFEDMTQVNKIRFESNVTAQGTAWIDAIGYSWDENYQIDDNKFAVISYPEKTNIQFMSNCTDTENDLASMRYYWDFGDGTSGWGKYPVHSYLTSGFYVVNLTCKDDNGITDWYTEIVLIHNLYPDILDITCSNNFTTINEGETILFNAESTDDESDLSRLSYWWDFEDDGFDPYNTSSYESGGWLQSHFYTDDYCGNAYIIVKDPEGALGYKAVLVNVSNVDPLLSIWDANILTNISFEVYRNSPSYDANFTFELLSNNDFQLISCLNFTGTENSLIYSDKTQIPMTLSKLWKIVVNTSEALPDSSWFRCYVKLQFLSGEILIITSSKLYGGEYGAWELDLNPYFFDNGDYTFKYPITFNAHIWDPSVDDISLSIQYNISMRLIIDCANTLPLEDSFTIEYPLSNVTYIINVYMEDGVKYVNITASQNIELNSFNDNTFPVSLNTNFTIYPIIDLYELLEIRMELTNLIIINCVQALNFLIGTAIDDDGGEGALTIIFNTEDDIEFKNLSPYIEQYIPDQALEGINVTFYVEISDYDQIKEQEEYYVANFRSSDIPTMPDDFDLINGTCDWGGELLFQNDNYATFTPDDDILNFFTTFYMENINSSYILKYLKLYYAYKAYTSAEVNLSLYNFHNETWTLIDSSTVGTEIYRNKYSILSAEFINDTYDILLKIETNTTLYLDQFKIEYYSAQVSDDGSFEHEGIPEQPSEFTLYSGSSGWEGDLDSIDDSYTTFISSDTSPTTGIIRPNGDITTHWSMSTPHYTRLDEDIEDPTSGDNYYIYTCAASQTEQYHFETIAGAELITQIEVKMYGKVTKFSQPTAQIYLGSWETTKTCNWGYESYTWSSLTWSDLNGSVSDLDDFQVKIQSPASMSGYLYLNTLYVIVTYRQYNGLTFTSDIHLDGLRPIDQIDSAELLYSFKTNISTEIDLSLYNYNSSSWDVVNTSTYTQFNNCSYEISGTDYFSPYYDVKVKFDGEHESIFEFYLEKFKLHYTWTKGSYEDDYVYNDYPDYPSDYTIYNGTHDTEGNLELQDNDYSIYNSTAGGDLNFYAILNLEAAQPGDVIKLLCLNYSYKTDIYQLINISLYNFTVHEWYQFDSSMHTEFFNGSYSIPISRIEVVNETEIEYHDFYDTNFNIFVKFEGANQSSQFQLFLDQLKVEYIVISYIFVGDSSGIINAVEEDYVSFDSELEGDSQVVDEIFELTLDQMNYHRFGVFESCQVSYSVKTTIPQNISINIFNYTESEWTEFASLTVDNSVIYNGSFVFNNKDFISSVYNVSVQILGINTTGNAFTLYLYKLEVKYNWSIAHADCGVDTLSYGLQVHYNMSSRYSTVFYEDFNFDYEGIYLVIMSADDGYHTTKTGKVINITKVDPFASIGHFTTETIEDRLVHFTSDIYVSGSNATMSDYKFFWLFGDGSFSNDPNPVHAYAKSGVYNISLTVIDCFGNCYSDVKNITIVEKAPEIVGPYTFYGIEGRTITLDVDIFDAFLDEIGLEYKWYGSSELISTDKKPTLTLEDGSYIYTLNVTDPLGQTATAEISVIVEDVPPVVIAPNYMYSGGSVQGSEGFFTGAADDPGELVLTAFSYDISDDNDLDYYWRVYKGDDVFGSNDYNSGISSTVKFRVKDTMLYRGEVKVVSGDKSTVATFIINSFIDDNGNGFSNEFEERLLETNENITAYSDTDGDCLSDLYEIGISNTSYIDPDTDGDGLYDGFDPDTGIGEWTAGTDPLNWDYDNDTLSDGLEVFGWKITSELLGETIVSSFPFDNDTDSDGLSDYDEYYTGTDPRNKDSDNDGAEDGIDPHPLKWDGDEDGLCDGLELEIGTNPNNTDTDSDGISDGEEVFGWAFQTNPLTSDTDRDFVADTAEYQNYKVSIDDRYDLHEPMSLNFEINCKRAMAAQIAFLITFGEAIDEGDKVYGIQDVPILNVSIYKADDNLLLFNMTTNGTRYFSQVVDIRETMENHSLDYRGIYRIQINDTEAGCLLEQFEIDITGYLDPNNDDFDNDGIMDGVEMGLLVEGIDTIDFEDSYWYDNLTVDMDEETWDEFYLEIPDIGRVYDADLYLKVESEGTPIGKGNVSIQLIKEELNCSISDAVLIDYTGNFDNISAFTYENSLDLSDYLNNNTIVEYYGTYMLKIIVFENNTYYINSTEFTNFTLSEFYIQTDTFIDAGPTDTEAWYTDPALPDSDFDGWDDYKEIFVEETNPLNVDTDFDGAWDPYDRDPKRDVMLEINPISGTTWWSKKPKLEIVIKYKLAGESQAIYTLRHYATVQGDPIFNIGPFTFYEWTAYFDGTHNSSNLLHYYINIDDDILVQGNDFEFGLQLWVIDGSSFCGIKWDEIQIKGTDIYTINDVGHSEIVNVTKMNDIGNKRDVKINVTTIGIEKANTIAVYEINDTSFTGHYSEAEKMNIIQLYINDTPSEDSPFVKGPNCIVIPTSLFTETILNGYIQTERLNETALYSSDEEKFKFISIERDGSVKQACDEVDFVLVRFDISYEDAEEILELILTCVVNETLDENNNTIAVNETLYTFVSTKLNGTTAVMLNLPSAALGFVPWFCENENSPLGKKPEDEDDVLENFLEDVGKVVLGIILSPFTLALAIWNMIENYVLEIIKMFILPILEYILWLIIRVILLVFFFILLAIEVIATTPLFLAMGVVLMAFSGLMDITIDWGVNLIPAYGKDTRIGFIDINMHGDNMLLEAWIKWDYWEYFDLYIPLLDMNFDADTDDIMDNVPEEPSDGTGTLLTCGFNQFDEYKFDFETTYWDTPYNDPPEYVNLTLVSPSGQSYNYTMEISPTGYKSIDYWVGKEDIRTGETYVYDETNNTFIPSNWYRGVRYNITIDFEEEFTSNQRVGRWYYQFHAKASRVNSSGVKWPVESYAIGPHFNNSGVVSNECTAQYLLYEDLYPYLGGSNKEFNFSVWWADYENNTLPTEVTLKLLLANGSVISCGMTNISSYQIDYSPVSDYGNVTFIEYKCTLNLSQYVEDEPVLFWHYYEGVHSSGNITMLTDLQYVDERGNLLSEADYWECENVTEVRVWFGGPQVFHITDGEPIIRKWTIEDLTNNIDLKSFGWLNPLYEEQEFKFWIYAYDPDRSPNYDEVPTCFNYNYPKLILTNRDNPNNTIVYDNFIWDGYNYDLEADRYWIRVNAEELGPGVWDFEFIMKDEQNNTDHLTKYDLPELWIIGSVAEIFSTLRDTIFYYGYIPISAFLTCAFISSVGGTYGQIIGIIVSMGVAIGFIIGALVVSEDMRKNSNSGGLLGYGWALLTVIMSIFLGLKVGGMFSSSESIGALKWRFLVEVLSIGQSILLTTTMFTYANDDIGMLSELLFYFSDFIGLASYSITLGFCIGRAPKQASEVIKKAIEIYTLALFYIAVWCICLAGEINGFYTFINN